VPPTYDWGPPTESCESQCRRGGRGIWRIFGHGVLSEYAALGGNGNLKVISKKIGKERGGGGGVLKPLSREKTF